MVKTHQTVEYSTTILSLGQESNWRYVAYEAETSMRSLCGPRMFHGPQEEHPVQMVLTDGKTADVIVAEQELKVRPGQQPRSARSIAVAGVSSASSSG